VLPGREQAGARRRSRRAPDRWRRARFSNYGWWVDACAPGVDVQSSFFAYEGPVAPHHEHDPDQEEHEQDDLHEEWDRPLFDTHLKLVI
jgi:hypothetical protein